MKHDEEKMIPDQVWMKSCISSSLSSKLSAGHAVQYIDTIYHHREIYSNYLTQSDIVLTSNNANGGWYQWNIDCGELLPSWRATRHGVLWGLTTWRSIKRAYLDGVSWWRILAAYFDIWTRVMNYYFGPMLFIEHDSYSSISLWENTALSLSNPNIVKYFLSL